MAYYIYEIWSSIEQIPIYVGYGKHDRKGRPHQRYEDHFYEASKYKNTKKTSKSSNLYKLNVINEVIENGGTLIYKFPYENITLSDAYLRETELILLYGRRDLDTGTLTNLDSGGRGGREWSQLSKDKLSKTNSGRISPTKGMKFGKYSDERKQAISAGRIRFIQEHPEHSSIMSEIRKTQIITEETKKKISESLKGRPSPMKGRVPWNKGLKLK